MPNARGARQPGGEQQAGTVAVVGREQRKGAQPPPRRLAGQFHLERALPAAPVAAELAVPGDFRRDGRRFKPLPRRFGTRAKAGFDPAPARAHVDAPNADGIELRLPAVRGRIGQGEAQHGQRVGYGVAAGEPPEGIFESVNGIARRKQLLPKSGHVVEARPVGPADWQEPETE